MIGVAVNIGKEPLFTLDERVAMVEHEVEAMMAADRVNGASSRSRPSSAC